MAMNTQISENKSKDSKLTEIEQYASYVIDGKHFDVERVFNNDASESLGMVLLKLIKAEIAPF